MGKYTYEDWKNRKVVLVFEKKDFNIEKNIPIVNYDDFTESAINEITQEKENVLRTDLKKKFDSFLLSHNLRKDNLITNTTFEHREVVEVSFCHTELAVIDDYFFGKIPHKFADKGGVYSIENHRKSQIFLEKQLRTNFKELNFNFVRADYNEKKFYNETFVYALWQLRVEIKKVTEFKFNKGITLFKNWEALYLFILLECSFEKKGELKKADYDFLFYKMKEVKAIKETTSQKEYVDYLAFKCPNLEFDIPDFKNRTENIKRKEIFDKVYEKSSYKLSAFGEFTIYTNEAFDLL